MSDQSLAGKHAGIPDPLPSPALEDGVQRLAQTLYDHVHGQGEWVHEDNAEMIENYVLDAQELAELMPHLLSGEERGIFEQMQAAKAAN